MNLIDKPLTPEEQLELKDKPYDFCLNCNHMAKTCDGPNMLAMTFKRMSDWCSSLAKQRGLSHADIAKGSKVAKGTVDNFLGARTNDIRMNTLQPIVKFLVGGCWGQYPCHQAQRYMEGLAAPEEQIEALEEELQSVRAELETAKRNSAHMNEIIANMQASHAAELAAVREDGQKKVDYLKETAAKLEKSNGRFMFVIVALAVVIIGALVVDYFNREIGFFWLSR